MRTVLIGLAVLVATTTAWGEALLPLACQEFERAQVNMSITGRALSIGGRAFATGLGAHAAGLIPFDVPRTDKAAEVLFSGWVGIDDDVDKDEGDGAVFVVSSGCAELWRSPVMKRHDAARHFEVTLPPGVTRVYLQMLAGANNWCDHCDWCDLRFTQLEERGYRRWASQWLMEPPPEQADMGIVLRDALARLQASGQSGTIEFAKGTYHFYVDSAPRLSFHVSNNDHPAVHPVAIPLVGLRQVKLKGNGSKFILHGSMAAVLVMDSADTELSGVDIEYAESQLFNATVVGFAGGRTIVKPDTRRCPYEIDGQGRIVYRCHGGLRIPMHGCMAFDGRTGEIIERTSDVGLARVVARNPDGTVALGRDYSKAGAGMKVGDVLVMRNHGRSNPSVVVYRAKDTVFEDVVVRNSFGMSLVGQRSENITFRGTRKAADRTAGMFAPEGTLGSISADATHFSNCRGLIAVENCWFEGMMDDAINVHSTCLRIQEKLAPNRIRCRYMHGQSIGFETFLPGETLRFIKGPVLENGTEVKVTAVTKLSARELEITLAENVPEKYGVGDAVENADYQPEVRFVGNRVAHNRARGCLFTTPKHVLVKDNVFDTVSGSAILFAGDAQGWYESGACRDVLVENNAFRNNLTSRFQFTEGIISVYPEIRRPAQQRQAYHANITIRKNRFETFDVPLLYARSTDGLHFDDNEVVYNTAYRGWGKPKFNVESTKNFTTENNRYITPAK